MAKVFLTKPEQNFISSTKNEIERVSLEETTDTPEIVRFLNTLLYAMAETVRRLSCVYGSFHDGVALPEGVTPERVLMSTIPCPNGMDIPLIAAVQNCGYKAIDRPEMFRQLPKSSVIAAMRAGKVLFTAIKRTFKLCPVSDARTQVVRCATQVRQDYKSLMCAVLPLCDGYARNLGGEIRGCLERFSADFKDLVCLIETGARSEESCAAIGLKDGGFVSESSQCPGEQRIEEEHTTLLTAAESDFVFSISGQYTEREVETGCSSQDPKLLMTMTNAALADLIIFADSCAPNFDGRSNSLPVTKLLWGLSPLKKDNSFTFSIFERVFYCSKSKIVEVSEASFANFFAGLRLLIQIVDRFGYRLKLDGVMKSIAALESGVMLLVASKGARISMFALHWDYTMLKFELSNFAHKVYLAAKSRFPKYEDKGFEARFALGGKLEKIFDQLVLSTNALVRINESISYRHNFAAYNEYVSQLGCVHDEKLDALVRQRTLVGKKGPEPYRMILPHESLLRMAFVPLMDSYLATAFPKSNFRGFQGAAGGRRLRLVWSRYEEEIDRLTRVLGSCLPNNGDVIKAEILLHKMIKVFPARMKKPYEEHDRVELSKQCAELVAVFERLSIALYSNKDEARETAGPEIESKRDEVVDSGQPIDPTVAEMLGSVATATSAPKRIGPRPPEADLLSDEDLEKGEVAELFPDGKRSFVFEYRPYPETASPAAYKAIAEKVALLTAEQSDMDRYSTACKLISRGAILAARKADAQLPEYGWFRSLFKMLIEVPKASREESSSLDDLVFGEDDRSVVVDSFSGMLCALDGWLRAINWKRSPSYKATFEDQIDALVKQEWPIFNPKSTTLEDILFYWRTVGTKNVAFYKQQVANELYASMAFIQPSMAEFVEGMQKRVAESVHHINSLARPISQEFKTYQDILPRLAVLTKAKRSLEWFEKVCVVLSDGIVRAADARDKFLPAYKWIRYGFDLLTDRPKTAGDGENGTRFAEDERDAVCVSFSKVVKAFDMWLEECGYSTPESINSPFLNRANSMCNVAYPVPINNAERIQNERDAIKIISGWIFHRTRLSADLGVYGDTLFAGMRDVCESQPIRRFENADEAKALLETEANKDISEQLTIDISDISTGIGTPPVLRVRWLSAKDLEAEKESKLSEGERDARKVLEKPRDEVNAEQLATMGVAIKADGKKRSDRRKAKIFNEAVTLGAYAKKILDQKRCKLPTGDPAFVDEQGEFPVGVVAIKGVTKPFEIPLTSTQCWKVIKTLVETNDDTDGLVHLDEDWRAKFKRTFSNEHSNLDPWSFSRYVWSYSGRGRKARNAGLQSKGLYHLLKTRMPDKKNKV